MSHKLVEIIPILKDRYSYVIEKDGLKYLIDAGNYEDIFEFLKKKDIHLDYILCTHHHSDHIDGISELKKNFNCKVYGPKDFRIKVMDNFFEIDKSTKFHESIDVIPTPGHTKEHIVYFFKDDNILFSGDLLFGAGCGRVSDGAYSEMFESLTKLKKLPLNTHIYFGHEYTVKNLEFAQSIEPENEDVNLRLKKAKHLRKKNEFTVPCTIKDELKTNPFLRVDSEILKKRLSMSNSSDLEVFIHLRKLKDEF